MEIDSAYYGFADKFAHQHLIGYSLMEADPLKHTASLAVQKHAPSHHHTHPQAHGAYFSSL